MDNKYTENQRELIAALDDTSEHVNWEFDEDEYQGASTIGFASVKGIDGRKSFVRSVRSAAENDDIPYVQEGQNGGYKIDVGGLEMSVSSGHNSGYRLSITNIRDFMSGPAHQRLDVREKLHSLALERLQKNGYLQEAYVRSRMD